MLQTCYVAIKNAGLCQLTQNTLRLKGAPNWLSWENSGLIWRLFRFWCESTGCSNKPFRADRIPSVCSLQHLLGLPRGLLPGGHAGSTSPHLGGVSGQMPKQCEITLFTSAVLLALHFHPTICSPYFLPAELIPNLKWAQRERQSLSCKLDLCISHHRFIERWWDIHKSRGQQAHSRVPTHP